jgi:hypothetical protein
MINPNYISQRPIGKFGSAYDAKSSRIWHHNIVKADMQRENAYQRELLRKMYPRYSLAEIEVLRIRLRA